MTVDSNLTEGFNQIFNSPFPFFHALDLSSINLQHLDVSVLGNEAAQKLCIIEFLQYVAFLLVLHFRFTKIGLLKPVANDFLFR